MLDTARRIAAILLTLALALGPGMGVAMASPGGGKVVMIMSSDMHSSSKCDDCGGSKAGMPVATCSVSCAGIMGVVKGAVVPSPLPRTAQSFIVSSEMTGLNSPPDPYPPRPTTLS